MHTDRSTILSLIATGRITPREAERLLAVWRDGDEVVLRLALCLAFVALVLPVVGDTMIAVGQGIGFVLPTMERALILICGVV